MLFRGIQTMLAGKKSTKRRRCFICRWEERITCRSYEYGVIPSALIPGSARPTRETLDVTPCRDVVLGEIPPILSAKPIVLRTRERATSFEAR